MCLLLWVSVTFILEAFLSEKWQRSKLDTRLTPSICSWFWMEFKLSASSLAMQLMYADVCWCMLVSEKYVCDHSGEWKGRNTVSDWKKTCVFYILILPAKNIRKIVIKKRHANRNNFLKQKGNKSDRLLMFQRKRFHIWAFYSILPEFQLGIGLRISLPENMFGFLPAAVPWKNGSFTLTCTTLYVSLRTHVHVILNRPAWAHSAPVLSRWWPHVAVEWQRL